MPQCFARCYLYVTHVFLSLSTLFLQLFGCRQATTAKCCAWSAMLERGALWWSSRGQFKVAQHTAACLYCLCIPLHVMSVLVASFQPSTSLHSWPSLLCAAELPPLQESLPSSPHQCRPKTH